MIYLIEAFDRKTELLVFEEELPDGCDEKLQAIMGWVGINKAGKATISPKSNLMLWRTYLGKKFQTEILSFN